MINNLTKLNNRVRFYLYIEKFLSGEKKRYWPKIFSSHKYANGMKCLGGYMKKIADLNWEIFSRTSKSWSKTRAGILELCANH